MSLTHIHVPCKYIQHIHMIHMITMNVGELNTHIGIRMHLAYLHAGETEYFIPWYAANTFSVHADGVKI